MARTQGTRAKGCSEPTGSIGKVKKHRKPKPLIQGKNYQYCDFYIGGVLFDRIDMSKMITVTGIKKIDYDK